MSSRSSFVVLVALVLLLVTASGTASAGVKLGEVSVGVGYVQHSGRFYPYPGYYAPAFYPYGYPYSYWGGPFWGDPYSMFFPPFGPQYYSTQRDATMGQVQLATVNAKAPVYIGGAFAGVAADLKKIWLAPGVYDIELRPEGSAAISQRVYVLTGKTVKIDFAKVRP